MNGVPITLKIAFALFKYFSFGGLQLDTMRSIRELLARGNQVTLFTGEIDSDLAELPGFSVEQIPLKSRTNHARALEFERVFHALADGKFDVTVAMNRITGCDFYFAADDCILEHFLQKRSRLTVALLPRYRIFTRIERELFSPGSPTQILCITERQKETFQRRYGTEESRFHLLPPGIPEKYRTVRADWTGKKRQSVRREFGIGENDFLAIFIGSDFLRKGLDRTIRLLASLPEDERKTTKLLVAGSGRQNQVLPLIRRYGLNGNILFAGPRNDTEVLLPAADLLVLLSYNEAAGSVIAESLCCGVPVLCSESCGFSPLVREAGSEVVPDPWSDEAARTLFRKMRNDSEEYRNKANEYADRTDFFRRAACMADILEKFALDRKNARQESAEKGRPGK